MGAAGVVFHIRSHKVLGLDAVLDQVVRAIADVLRQSDNDIWLIIENCAGDWSSFKEIGIIVNAVDDPRLKQSPNN